MSIWTNIGLIGLALAAPAAGGLEQRVVEGNPTVELSRVNYKGAAAVRLVDKMGPTANDSLIVVDGTQFHNGIIEAEVAGLPAKGAFKDARGFIGIAFRVKDRDHYEAFFIRPTNGRVDDQLRRNHATQYIGMPDYPWFRLRKENPGVYESYADMVAGEWTRLRIQVEGSKARLFVGRANQPSLVVNDLKNAADGGGGVALWIGTGTEGYFRNVRVQHRD
jgi:hypothetical protein